MKKGISKKKTAVNRKSGDSGRRDYGCYHFSGKEWVKYSVIYLGLDGVISYLFFHSAAAFFLLLPGCVIFFRDRKKILQEQRAQEIQSQFLTGMQLVCTSLQAGYAVENAFREALTEVEKIYEGDSFIVQEFRHIVSQISLNCTIETLLAELGQRSHAEDIRSFSEVFYIAKRTGGDLVAIVQNTISCIRQKQETKQEIDTSLAGKKMEQEMMSGIPLFILGYVKLTSPGFLDAVYDTAAGRVVMILCLAVYLCAYFWGRNIIRIQV